MVYPARSIQTHVCLTVLKNRKNGADQQSDNTEAQKIVDSLEPSQELSGQFGVGGNIRELGHVSEKSDRQGLVLAQGQVYDQLRKGRKLLVRPDLHGASCQHAAKLISRRTQAAPRT